MEEKLMTENEQWFNEFELEVKDFKYLQKLKGKEVLSFFENELQNWKTLQNEMSTKYHTIPSSLRQLTALHQEIDRSNQILKNTVLNDSIDKVKDAANNLIKTVNRLQGQSPLLVYSKSTLGVLLHDSYLMEPDYGEGIYKYFNKQYIDPNNWKSLKGFIHGFIFEAGFDSSIKLKTDIELDLLTKQRNEWEQRGRDVSYEFEKIKSQLQDWKENFTLDAEKWQQDHGEQLEGLKKTKESELDTIAKEKREGLENLEKTYRNWIQIEAPVRYWKTRARNYRKRGWFWMALTVVFTLFVVEPLFYILYNTPDSFHGRLLQGDPLAIKSLIVFALIISFLTYLIRIAARMTLSSFHIERDAEEREQLTYVYLALSKEGKIDEKDKTIILQSLFSRVDTGILKEDSAPTMPSIGTVIERFIKK